MSTVSAGTGHFTSADTAYDHSHTTTAHAQEVVETRLHLALPVLGSLLLLSTQDNVRCQVSLLAARRWILQEPTYQSMSSACVNAAA